MLVFPQEVAEGGVVGSLPNPPLVITYRIAYRMRGSAMARLINRLKPFRQGATRSEKLAVTYLAIVTIVALLIWL